MGLVKAPCWRGIYVCVVAELGEAEMLLRQMAKVKGRAKDGGPFSMAEGKVLSNRGILDTEQVRVLGNLHKDWENVIGTGLADNGLQFRSRTVDEEIQLGNVLVRERSPSECRTLLEKLDDAFDSVTLVETLPLGLETALSLMAALDCVVLTSCELLLSAEGKVS